MLQVTYKKQTNKYNKKIEKEVGLMYIKKHKNKDSDDKVQESSLCIFVHTIVAKVLQCTKFAMDKKYIVMTLELYHH